MNILIPVTLVMLYLYYSYNDNSDKEHMRANPHYNNSSSPRGRIKHYKKKQHHHHYHLPSLMGYEYSPYGYYNGYGSPGYGYGYGHPGYYDFGGRCRTITYSDDYGFPRQEVVCVPRPVPYGHLPSLW